MDIVITKTNKDGSFQEGAVNYTGRLRTRKYTWKQKWKGGCDSSLPIQKESRWFRVTVTRNGGTEGPSEVMIESKFTRAWGYLEIPKDKFLEVTIWENAAGDQGVFIDPSRRSIKTPHDRRLLNNMEEECNELVFLIASVVRKLRTGK